MRNIKSTLRFVRNSALLFVAASGVTYLTGCQSENSISPDNPNNEIPEANLKTASYTVYGPNQNRVRNYGNTATRGVDAALSFEMPENAPAVPEGTESMGGLTNEYGWKVSNGGDFVVPAGETCTVSQGAILRHTYYVAGTWNAPNGFGGVEDAVIYILPGGTLNVGSALQPGLTIYNYGTIKGSFTVGENAKVYSAVDIDEVNDFSVNTGGEFYSRKSVMADEFVRLNGTAIACAFIANKIDVHEKGTVKTSYFKANDLTFNAGKVELDNNGLVEVKKLNITNDETRFTVNGTNAVVYAEEFNCSHRSKVPPVFAKEIACKFDKCLESGSVIGMNDLGLQSYSENQVVYVPAAGCHGEFGQKPTDNNGGKEDENNNGGEEGGENGGENPPAIVPEDPDQPIETPQLVKVTEIEGLDNEINHGDHDHGIISATCITFGADGTAYASYHLRGAGTGDHNQPNYVGEYAQKGCIEVIKDNGDAGMVLGSYMIAPDWDFNHLIVDGNRIVTVGNSKPASAFIGTLPTSFEASTGVNNDFSFRELTTNIPVYQTSDKTGEEIRVGFTNAGDGNCVVRQGNYYYVATYEGYGPLTLNFGRVNDAEGNKIFKKTNGSAKHIAINGGNMSVIALDSYNKTSSTASVYNFGADDFSFANILKTYDNVGTVEPVDGKNVIAVDGNDIYACLSKGGLVRVNDGKKFQRGKNGKVPVNGMAFDENYIYVANGSFVSVLDKETMNEICYYHAPSQKSANYIALRNGKIYVAFGEDGIQVFKLVQKEIAQQ